MDNACDRPTSRPGSEMPIMKGSPLTEQSSYEAGRARQPASTQLPILLRSVSSLCPSTWSNRNAIGRAADPCGTTERPRRLLGAQVHARRTDNPSLPVTDVEWCSREETNFLRPTY
jgi:hypothetical protein